MVANITNLTSTANPFAVISSGADVIISLGQEMRRRDFIATPGGNFC
jgi:hypothetical protein